MYRVICKEHRAPLIFDKGQDEDDTDDHAGGDEDDDDEAGVHVASLVIVTVVFLPRILLNCTERLQCVRLGRGLVMVEGGSALIHIVPVQTIREHSNIT